MKKLTLFALMLLIFASARSTERMSLNDVIRIASERSFDAMVARLNFMSSYWSYRSFRAELLPSINLHGNLMEYNHSTVETRDYESGRISMVDNNSLSNRLTLSIDQNIAALGGTFSLQSYLYRLDQFDYGSKIYNAQPLRISYNQPLRAFNSLKWEKKIQPVAYDMAKRTYLEAMEIVTTRAADLFFSVLSAQSYLEQSKQNLNDRERLFEISKNRLELGTVTKSDHLQMELSLLNARMDVKEKALVLVQAKFSLFNYLQLSTTKDIELIPPYYVPNLTLDAEKVVERALEGSSHLLEEKLTILNAERNLAQAKANRGIQLQLNGELGFNRTANNFPDAFRNMENSQIVGVTLSLPIFDWGVSKGRIHMAKADLEAVKMRQEQAHEEYVQDIRMSVVRFNMQNEQCENARRAGEIADERYEITKRRYEAGILSVTELNTAWQEAQSARASYMSQLQMFWSNYYSIRKVTLYDWLMNTELTVDYDKLIHKQ